MKPPCPALEGSPFCSLTAVAGTSDVAVGRFIRERSSGRSASANETVAPRPVSATSTTSNLGQRQYQQITAATGSAAPEDCMGPTETEPADDLRVDVLDADIPSPYIAVASRAASDPSRPGAARDVILVFRRRRSHSRPATRGPPSRRSAGSRWAARDPARAVSFPVIVLTPRGAAALSLRVDLAAVLTPSVRVGAWQRSNVPIMGTDGPPLAMRTSSKVGARLTAAAAIDVRLDPFSAPSTTQRSAAGIRVAGAVRQPDGIQAAKGRCESAQSHRRRFMPLMQLKTPFARIRQRASRHGSDAGEPRSAEITDARGSESQTHAP